MFLLNGALAGLALGLYKSFQGLESSFQDLRSTLKLLAFVVGSNGSIIYC